MTLQGLAEDRDVAQGTGGWMGPVPGCGNSRCSYGDETGKKPHIPKPFPVTAIVGTLPRLLHSWGAPCPPMTRCQTQATPRAG